MTHVLEEAARAVTGSGRLAEVAEAVGKTWSQLMRELDPADPHAKFGAETLLAIMKETGDPSPLAAMAEEMGYCLVPDGEPRSVHADRMVRLADGRGIHAGHAS